MTNVITFEPFRYLTCMYSYVTTTTVRSHLSSTLYVFITTTSREANTVTVTALKTHDTATTAAWISGTLQIENTLNADRTIATATYM